MLEKIFSRRRSQTHVIWTILGIKLKFKKINCEILQYLKEIKQQQDKFYAEFRTAHVFHDSTAACDWLKNKSFSPIGGAANYTLIYLLFKILDNVNPASILEFGLGQTSRLTSQYTAWKNEKSRLMICEHDRNWINIYQSQLPSSERINIIPAELEYFSWQGQQNDKYKDLPAKIEGKVFDLFIIDGPIGIGKNYPRSNIIDLIPQYLAENFIIIFDDAEREGEQTLISEVMKKLSDCGIDFVTYQKTGLKTQFVIASPVYAYTMYL